MKIQELIDTTLSKLPKIEIADSEFSYEVTTSNRHGRVYLNKNTCIVEKSKLEETHCQQILSLIELHRDMQCCVRVMPEISKSEDPGAYNYGLTWYTRLQFKKACKCPNCGYIIYKEDIWIK
uniref:Uncharacterized protein n=1 Tax=viral metagenome TaxID=1070528 RepID=A0A6M3XG90_9ZZZZ